MRLQRLARCVVIALALLVPSLGVAQDTPEAGEPGAAPVEEVAVGVVVAEEEEVVVAATRVAVAPLRVNSAEPHGDWSLELAEVLAERLERSDGVRVIGPGEVIAVLGDEKARAASEASDDELRRMANDLDVAAIVTASVTELAGRYSLDTRLVSASAGQRPQTMVFTASGREALDARLAEVADRVAGRLSNRGPGTIISVEVLGSGEIEEELLALVESGEGDLYDPALAREDAKRLDAHSKVARASLDSERTSEGVRLQFRIVRSEVLFASGSVEEGEPVAAIEIRGNRRIDRDAIRSRLRTKVGDPLRPNQLAADVREIFALGFFKDVRVFKEEGDLGLVLVLEVEENPVVRQIAIIGNDNIDSEDVRDILTLTTGSTLDYPLLYENTQRIEGLYKSKGYYLAEVSYEIEPIAEGSVAINFDVDEKEKLRLQGIEFEGNEHFTNSELTEDFATKRWRWWSWATSWFDQSGTYSEPTFMRDLRSVEKIYTDAGYLQVEVGEPDVDANKKGLDVVVDIVEGPQFDVGKIDVTGDETVDLDALREKLKLSEGEIFNRSHLTQDVESLERHYTDRGFYFASVQPATALNEEKKTVDVDFRVEKGPLYFIRHINVVGNTETVDPVIRREMVATEGQLYSARALQVSTRRIQQLGFFENVAFEPKSSEDPSLLDLDVNVVERPTGSFSFGAGFSSQDSFIFNASLSQSNLFGRGYGANLSADIGGNTSRFFLSFSDPYFLGTTFSLGTTLFWTSVKFEDFEQDQKGIDVTLGHDLNEDGSARGSIRYGFARRKIEQDTGVNAAAVIFRELLQGNESSSTVGMAFRVDTRDDRFAPTSGRNYGGTVEYAGLGGFANFLRFEGRHAWYLGAPSWMIERSTFVLSNRIGYTIPFNTLSDYDFPALGDSPGCTSEVPCDGVGRLDQIDTDQKLPLTERYFLGGIGTFQLRGFKARSVGPRRSILRRGGFFGTGDLFLPVGRVIVQNPQDGGLSTECLDGDDPSGFNNQGNGNGKCNDIDDTQIDDFEDLDETDVIGGNKFITTSLEYRFPISEEVGLQGVIFADSGNAFAEGDNMFDPPEWRYGVGGGVLWFSPFGPLQLVLGFPLDREPQIEDSPVFEFSVGGFGL